VGRDGPAPGVGGMWYACDAFWALYADDANDRVCKMLRGISLGSDMVVCIGEI